MAALYRVNFIHLFNKIALKIPLMRSTIFQSNHLVSRTVLVNIKQDFHSTNCNLDTFNVQDRDDFDDKVLKSKIPVIVDFHAGWCGPCKLLAPRLESLMNAYHGKMHLAKVDVDDNDDLAMEYDVKSIPAVMGFKDGKVEDSFIGLLDEDQIKSFLDKVYGPKK